MTEIRARVFLLLQYLLPRYALTACTYRLARVRLPLVKNLLIRGFVRLFRVDVSDAAAAVPDGYASFNEFFTRALAPGSRDLAAAADTLVSPVDGTLSAAGRIERGRLLQAKGRDYSLHDLLATDIDDAAIYEDGSFATIYLAPYNYHRVHAPFAGRLVAARYVPGDLFSVNEATVAALPGLFARNERLVCHFQTDRGPFVLLFVGALNVGSISTPWTGEIRPRRRGVVEELGLGHSGVDLQVARGDLLGWFNMGSTVILLLPRGGCTLADDLQPGRTLRMGEAIATCHGAGG